MSSTNMPTSLDKIIAVAVLVLIIGGIVGGYFFPVLTQPLGQSAQGSTFGTKKTASIAIKLSAPGANATSSSILNTDANDRYVEASHLTCEGVGSSKTAYTGTGLASLQLSIGTTTTAAPGNFSSANAVALNYVIGTSSAPTAGYASSTLQTASSTFAMIWPANTYMTFFFNATNTANCTVGVDYTGS